MQSVGCEMENFDTIAESVVGAIIKQACQGVEDRLGEYVSSEEVCLLNAMVLMPRHDRERG